ncbi:Uncharacterised protein [Algoriella xinjiangensis]|nr:Uncharacterised protein [Algoriella xinjiangensis]
MILSCHKCVSGTHDVFFDAILKQVQYDKEFL